MARKILLADDSVTAQNMGRKILADAGYEVVTVNNGSAALKKINEQRPDVIVLDVYMPGYSGLEVCQRLKEAGDTSRIPILLTVGKLEPFKPEEAKRVRADGFIVKPFEASELLSALTKLEDKIVPRSETSKPGRFSRAIAAMDDPRLDRSAPFDKTMVVEEDSSWKNRISFPAKGKKREAEVEEPVEQASKDLRSVIDKIPEGVPRPSTTPVSTPEEKVDLSALSPAGLPKDVTPEEIAALAAAAARMKGKLPEPEMPVVAPPESQVQAVQEPFVESARLIQTPEPVSEAKAELKDQLPTPILAPEPLIAESSERSPEISIPESHEPSSPDEPVTIAAAAAAASGGSASRWMAVSVALTPEETGISLEQEMQKAYGAYEAAESGHSNAASFIPPVAAENVASATTPEAPISVPAIKAPEEAQAFAAVATLATEAVSAAVKELETVATAFAETAAASESEAPARAAEGVTPAEASQPGPEPLTETAWSDALQPALESRAVVEAVQPGPPADLVPAASPSQASVQEISSPTEPETQLSESRPESTHVEPHPAGDSAAAAASWKHVPEAGNDNGAAAGTPQISAPASQDTAAMAAAVGGKNALEELTTAAEDDPAIASIVDSVLADLRPKIVEEISRKLGRKK